MKVAPHRKRRRRMRHSLTFVLLLIPTTVSGQQFSAACDTIAQVVADIPTVTTTRTDTLVVNHRMDRTAPGCRVRVTGSRSAFGERNSPDERLRNEWASRGWTEDFRYAADGPDGTAFALIKGPVLCMFEAAWDGGDDSDPSYVPDDRYQLIAWCMEHQPQ
jgi:hypothetical protein